MKKLFVIGLAAVTLMGASGAQAQRKSALDGHQFDGVQSDAGLKRSGLTREKWLDLYPVQARAYWDAWDCKDKACDTKWKANIRAKAALITKPKGNGSPSDLVSTE